MSDGKGGAGDALQLSTKPTADLSALSHKNDQNDLPTVQDLPGLVNQILQPADRGELLLGVQGIRKLLSLERDPPIDEVIGSGVVEQLLDLMDAKDSEPLLQFEAVWAVTNVASGRSEHVAFLHRSGAIPRLLALLAHTNRDIVEQAVWAVGNIAGDSVPFRDVCLREGAADAVLAIATSSQLPLSLRRNIAWTISNLCRGKPVAPWQQVSKFVRVLVSLLGTDDEETKCDALWAFTYLTDGQNDKIQTVIESGACRLIVACLQSALPMVVAPAVRCIGNIVTGTDMQTQVVLNCGFLRLVPPLLGHAKAGIRKETCWALSNLLAGSPTQVQAVLDAEIMPLLLEVLGGGDDRKVRQEAAWAVSNFTSSATSEQLHAVVKQGAVTALASVLTENEARLVRVALEGLQNLLAAGNSASGGSGSGTTNQYAAQLRGTDGFELIRRVATGYTRADAEITVLCQGLVADYFGGEDLAYPPGEEPEEEDLDVVMGLMNQLELQQGDQQGQEQGDQGQGDDDAQGDDQVDAEAS